SCAASTPGDALFKAAHDGNVKKVSSLVPSASQSDVSQALKEAAFMGHLNVVQAIIALGADINGNFSSILTEKDLVQNDGTLDAARFYTFCSPGKLPIRSPLIAATRAGKSDVVKWLADHGADIDLQGWACIFEDMDQQQEPPHLIKFRPVVAEKGNNALSEAILAGETSIAQVLIAHGADLSRSVVWHSADIPALRELDNRDRNGPNTLILYIGGSAFPDYGTHLKPSDGGFMLTDIDAEQQRETTIRELASNSTILEIRALVGTQAGVANGGGNTH
ncbi:MAG: ankyrin repeat domain-containing protein, partial [Ktedonobacteraceae bacterium]